MEMKKIKKFIAKEGLLLLGICIGAFVVFIVLEIAKVYSVMVDDIPQMLLIIYIGYFLIRFIVWAIKTVREK